MKPQINKKPNFWVYEKIGALKIGEILNINKDEWNTNPKYFSQMIYRAAKVRELKVKIYSANNGWVIKRIG